MLSRLATGLRASSAVTTITTTATRQFFSKSTKFHKNSLNNQSTSSSFTFSYSHSSQLSKQIQKLLKNKNEKKFFQNFNFFGTKNSLPTNQIHTPLTTITSKLSSSISTLLNPSHLHTAHSIRQYLLPTSTGFLISAGALTSSLPTPVQDGSSASNSTTTQRPPRRRGMNRGSPETEQDDVFHPSGRPPNPIPALAWEIRRDIAKPEYKKVLQDAMGSNWAARPQPKWDESDPTGSVESLIARIVHDMHRVSICIAPIAQNLSLVNSMGQMYNREKKRGIIPVFDLDRLASFQRRLVNRYKKVIELIPHNDDGNGEQQPLDKELAQQRFASLQGALQLCLYDVSLMYAIDSAIAQHHPRHPKSFLQQSIKAQADYLMQRRNLIAKQIRSENPEIIDDDFKSEFNKRITFDTQLMNEMLEQRRVDEQKRWAQMQRAQILRARQRRHQQLQEQKKLATGNQDDGDGGSNVDNSRKIE